MVMRGEVDSGGVWWRSMGVIKSVVSPPDNKSLGTDFITAIRNVEVIMFITSTYLTSGVSSSWLDMDQPWMSVSYTVLT